MKKLWMTILVIGTATLMPTKTRADIKCEGAPGCGECNAAEIVYYTDSDGNGYYVAVGCCACA